MASETNIANMAFRSLGSTPIDSLDEQTPNGKLAKSTYDEYRDSFLSSHPWKFATLQTELVANPTAPTWAWEAAYDQPVEPNFCLRVLHVNGEGLSPNTWQPYKHQILCNFVTPIQIEYIYRSKEYGYWDPVALDAFSDYLALKWAMQITQDTDIVEQRAALYERTVRKARAVNGAEGTPRQLVTSSWVNSRWGPGDSIPLVKPAL